MMENKSKFQGSDDYDFDEPLAEENKVTTWKFNFGFCCDKFIK